MASTDAKPVPQKNVAYRATFPILDADGDLVTGAASLDSEVSIDGGTFADCTNEATEIATSSGVYYLDLTQAEMNGDTIAVIVKTGTAGAKTTVLVFYPEEAGDIRVNVTQVAGTTQTAGDIIGDTNDIQSRLPAALVSGRMDASVGAMAANTLTASALAADAVTEIQSGLATAAALDTVDNFLDTEIADIQARLPAALVGGRMDSNMQAAAAGVITASVVATGAIDADALATDAVTEIADGVLDRNMATGTDSGSETVRTVRQALRASRNRVAISAGTATVYKENDTDASWTAAVTTAAGNPISEVDPASA